jgi:hypothetical protein
VASIDREHQSQIVTAQKAVAKPTPDDTDAVGMELPDDLEHGLSFSLGLSRTGRALPRASHPGRVA